VLTPAVLSLLGRAAQWPARSVAPAVGAPARRTDGRQNPDTADFPGMREPAGAVLDESA